jgi:hypothetical protein
MAGTSPAMTRTKRAELAFDKRSRFGLTSPVFFAGISNPDSPLDKIYFALTNR